MRLTPAQRFFSKEEQNKIVEAIQQAEKDTSAEIRVHIENFCFTDPVRRAQKIFIKHGMHRTENRNAVLFYFAILNKKLAIIGDQGIHEKVGSAFWEGLVKELIEALKANINKAEVLCACIMKVGHVLSTYFPPSSTNPNELSNNISFE